MSTPEGYATPEGTGYRYVYQFKDHLGNTRLSYTKNDSGNLEIIEENNYYPFGLTHKGYNNIVSSLGNSTAQNYKYQSQELNENLGYNMYEFELRHYDATIGRFVTTDPYEQFMSPYLAMGNNPIVSFDPDGGYCVDANGNQIACPEGAGDLYDDVRDSETNHIEILDEAQVGGGSSEEESSSETASYGGSKGQKVLPAIGDLSGFSKFRAEFQENILDGRSTNIDGITYPVDASGRISGIGIIEATANLPFGPGGAKNLANLRPKSISLPSLKKINIDMDHIISGHTIGGSRASSIKTLFGQNSSPKQIERMIKTAYSNAKKIKTQGNRVKLRGTSSDGTIIEIWLNKVTRTIETAYPLKH
ncbi:RHS repeat domain-containing protein [Aquimarina algiphila]|uniref:Uncharacterized protein n=3 Tax=Aquimarina algiphila TaxID=2047982 RepID=A0A554VAI5_9FLAO|nr:RHS repeat-associated core domain-containing protein [Aquimarina algiphila]TSE03147.1 hypothetical protein FOF46_29875 [Aquimarina algiphila]